MISNKKYLVVKTIDAKLALLEFILVEVWPPPDLGINDVGKSFSARNLQLGYVTIENIS